jgi:ABC-type multidrug transport system ATPase subunit
VAYEKVRLCDLTFIRPLCCNGDLRSDRRETRRVTPVVEMKGIVKHFGLTRALSGLDFRVERSEVVALLGPNGAGKTTAIAIMLGLRTPSSGEVRLLGRRPRDLAARSRVGVKLQESGVPDELRVREIVDLFSSYYPRPLPSGEAIARSGLEDKERALVGSLSGGQRQRLFYALAICGDPVVLFLGEPTVGLDVEARRSFWEQVRGSVEAGRTVILTTHYLEEADALADRVVVIDRGRVVAERGRKMDVLMRATPLRPAVLLCAKTVSALLFALATLAVLFGFGRIAGGVEPGAWVWATLAYRLLLGSVPFVFLGFTVGYLARPSSAVPVIQLIYLPIAFASGLFVPLESLPEIVQEIAPYLPTYRYAELAWSAVGANTEPLSESVVWLAGYGVAFPLRGGLGVPPGRHQAL